MNKQYYPARHHKQLFIDTDPVSYLCHSPFFSLFVADRSAAAFNYANTLGRWDMEVVRWGRIARTSSIILLVFTTSLYSHWPSLVPRAQQSSFFLTIAADRSAAAFNYANTLGGAGWARGGSEGAGRALLHPLCPGSLSWNRELRAPPTHPLTLLPLPGPPLVQQFPLGLKYQRVGHPAQVSGLDSSTPAPLHLPHLQQCVLQFYKADLSHQFFRSLQRTVLS